LEIFAVAPQFNWPTQTRRELFYRTQLCWSREIWKLY